MRSRKIYQGCLAFAAVMTALGLTACASSGAPENTPIQNGSRQEDDESLSSTTVEESPVPADSSSQAIVSEKGSRDNTPLVPEQDAPGTEDYSNDVAAIDVSHSSAGYCMARYFGSNPKVKLIITGPDQVQYRYDLTSNEYTPFPFTAGSGSYSIGVYENVTGTTYSTSMKVDVSVNLKDEFQPFLVPSQYVNYSADCDTVEMGAELSEAANNDLDVVASVYNYLIDNITYDYAKAENPPTGYLSDVDATLASGTGICLDYAAVMTSMLRSQRIPTKLEVGYAGTAYHAWISTYITDIGWVNGIVEFDGKGWKLMDPTFAANTSEKALREYIGDGSNYVISYEY